MIDGVRASVFSVGSSAPDGHYKVGDVIPIEVEFSENVYVEGLPQLMMSMGQGDPSPAEYYSGSGSNVLIFEYAVSVGDTTPDLDYLDQNPIALGAGLIHDVAGNSSNLEMPEPGEEGSISQGKDFVIDGILPNIEYVYSLTPNGSYSAGDMIQVALEFNEPVTVTSATSLHLILDVGVEVAFAGYAQGSGTNTITMIYTVSENHNSHDLNYLGVNAIESNGSYIRDDAGNESLLVLPDPNSFESLSGSSNLIVDTAEPYTFLVWKVTLQ